MEFTEADLKKAVTHLAFDVQHFRCYLDLHRNTKLQRTSPAACQAVRYSLLLHLRLLLNFFYGRPREDDCCIRHFKMLPGFSAAFPSNSLFPTPDEARQVSINLNKRLAHLTATRWEVPAPSMAYYQKYFDGVDRLIDAFEDALPDDVRTLFVKRLQVWQKSHPATI